VRSVHRCRTEIRQALKRKQVLVFLDFDGTLAPIAATPAEARMNEQTSEALHALAQAPRARVAILSGRPLSFLARRFDDRRFFCGGNHGLEMRGPGFQFCPPGAEALRPEVHAVARRATNALGGIPGVLIEDKGLTMSVHYRRIPTGRQHEFQQELQTFRQQTNSRSFRWRRGKMIWELLPNLDWHKGRAAEILCRHLRSRTTVAMGDDITDEDMFRSLKSRGPTVRVGRRIDSLATYYLSKQSDVPDFLRQLAEALQ